MTTNNERKAEKLRNITKSLNEIRMLFPSISPKDLTELMKTQKIPSVATFKMFLIKHQIIIKKDKDYTWKPEPIYVAIVENIYKEVNDYIMDCNKRHSESKKGAELNITVVDEVKNMTKITVKTMEGFTLNLDAEIVGEVNNMQICKVQDRLILVKDGDIVKNLCDLLDI